MKRKKKVYSSSDLEVLLDPTDNNLIFDLHKIRYHVSLDSFIEQYNDIYYNNGDPVINVESSIGVGNSTLNRITEKLLEMKLIKEKE